MREPEQDSNGERCGTFEGEGMQLSEEVREIMLQQPLNPFKRVKFSLLPRVYKETLVVEWSSTNEQD